MMPAAKMAQLHCVEIRIKVLIRRRQGLGVCTICKGEKRVSLSIGIGTGPRETDLNLHVLA